MSTFDQDLSVFERALQELVSYLKEHQDAAVPFPAPPQEVKSEIPLNVPKSGGGMEAAATAVQAYLKNALPTQSPRFMNQLFSGVSLSGALGELLCALTNTSMYTYEVAPAATLIERSLLSHMGNKVGYDDGEGIFVSGGTNANHVSMLMAREQVRQTSTSSKGKRPTRGMRESKPLVAFCSKDAHYSFETSAHIMGFEDDQLVKVETDDKGRMNPRALQAAIQKARDEGLDPFYVAATAGTTVRGVFDPIAAIADVLDDDKKNAGENTARIWFHVDGAWGGAASLSDAHREKLAGSDRSDSFTWDTHKLMGLPLICSVVLTRRKGHLEQTQGATTHGYLFHMDDDESNGDEPKEQEDGSHLNLGKHSLACGRRASSLKLWLAWQAEGDSGFEKRVDDLYTLQEQARRRVQQSDVIQEACAGDWMNLCFTLGDDKRSGEERDAAIVNVRKFLADEGVALVNYATVNERSVIRMIFANPALTSAHVDVLFDRIEEFAKGIA
ncbi:MAG: hypothetical protein GY822_26585 [Deltaproteobacteria bacterium]|nr:hypothetical protein [Deltaproteobacteria bacterium]